MRPTVNHRHRPGNQAALLTDPPPDGDHSHTTSEGDVHMLQHHRDEGAPLQAARPETERSVERKVRVFIGHGVRFEGVLAYEGTIRIDGEMEGEIRTGGCLIIGDGAVVTAKVTAGTLRCQGTVKGDVVVESKAEFRRPAVLLGSIATPVLIIEEGVRLKGNVKMIGSRPPDFIETAELDASDPVRTPTPEPEPA